MSDTSNYGTNYSPAPENMTPLPNEKADISISSRALAASSPSFHGYMEGLNPEQKKAVENLEGPLLVLAGAGTGKTRVLTTRITHILTTGRAWPNQILAVTFTNKAAREMKNRIGQYMGDRVEGMRWLGTFHAICVKILRQHAELVDLKSSFTIMDTDDQVRLLKQLIRAERIDDKRWPARQLASRISGWKNRALTPGAVPEAETQAFADGEGRTLYQQYQERLKIQNSVDFDDLLTECIQLFRENNDILASYQERFKYILVDEYQDTNIAQYLWLKLLTQNGQKKDEENRINRNICCVGDDDQSIYGWRGAEISNILRFERDFPGAKTIRLECNYRSTQHILSAASHLISHNEDRLGKTLFSSKTDSGDKKVTIANYWDSQEEARTIGEEIENYQHAGKNLNNIAILVRAAFQMREFEDRFVTLGLNYRVIGGPRFYERREIRDCLAYFRVVCQPADNLAFERIINIPKRGIGEASLRLIHKIANQRERVIPLFQAAHELTETDEISNSRTRSTLRNLLDHFNRWNRNLETMPHAELAKMILDESGYIEMWKNERTADAPGRLENLRELVRSMEDFDSMTGFLEHVSLLMDNDRNEKFDAVSLMTLHSAKGLEFDHVFLPGWEDGLFPHQRSLDESGEKGLEEERRLAYVGITRAKESCHISFASNRQIHGLWQTPIPSRFIEELPPANTEIAESDHGYGGYARRQSPGARYGQMHNSTYNTHHGTNRKTIEGHLIASSIEEATSRFSVGDRVFHMKFGNGNVVFTDGNRLTINFDKAGQKRVLDSFVDKI